MPGRSAAPRLRYAQVLGVVALGMFAHLVIYLAGLAVDAPATALNTAYYSVAVVAFVSLGVASQRGSRRTRVATALVAFMVACWLTGDVVFTAWGGDPPPIAHCLYYAGYIALACAIPLLGLPAGTRPDWHALLDGLAVVAVVGSLFWRFLVEPSIAGVEDPLETFLTAGYPVVDLAVFAMLILTFYQRASGRGAHQFVALALAAAILVATDGAVLVTPLGAYVEGPSVLDIGWMAAYFLFAALPLLQGEAPERQTPSRIIPSVRLALPYAVTLPFAVIAFADASRHGGVPVLLSGLIVATTFILTRQWLTLAENARLRARAEFLLRHDSLTGLLSHRAWFEAAAAPGIGSIAILDVDHFKAINDRFGHPAGDEVLVEIARRLAVALPGATHLGRVGGEEFAILFPDDAIAAARQCDDAIAAIAREPVHTEEGLAVPVSISIGLANFRAESSLMETYRAADEQLYRAKREGRNRLRVA